MAELKKLLRCPPLLPRPSQPSFALAPRSAVLPHCPPYRLERGSAYLEAADPTVVQPLLPARARHTRMLQARAASVHPQGRSTTDYNLLNQDISKSS